MLASQEPISEKLKMADSEIINPGEEHLGDSRRLVGGKGSYLIRLNRVAQNTGLFQVPNFFIISSSVSQISENIIRAYENLRKPVMVRSSSPLEDGLNASFAGLFGSFSDISTVEDFVGAYRQVVNSATRDSVQRYAKRMSVDFSPQMAVIVQEQVVNPWLRGVVQLDREERSFRCELIDRAGELDTYDLEFEFTQEISHEPRDDPQTVFEGDYWALAYAARAAKNALDLGGVVQVEACFSPNKPISLVQIRELPKVRSYLAELDLEPPSGLPYLESSVCNDVAGDLILPAYTTVSQSGLCAITIPNGFMRDDGRAEKFMQQSKLAQNPDFQLVLQQDRAGITELYHFDRAQSNPAFAEMWERGNSLFDNYILVCDKLDDSFYDMGDLTSNKRAIITCLEDVKTSHAMTVARDLGIMCMGVHGNSSDMNYFFNQVETGDIVHMKSDGKKAVAFIEKKKEYDPYEAS